ncbi:MAG: ester cyclase [Acidobacteriaceae bacterium]|nr:ester cyclase [Acidobacteriaceae bacterium]
MTTDIVDTKRAQRESIVNQHIEAEAIRHDIAGTLNTFKHPRYEVPALGTVADGAEAVNGLLGALLNAFPDFYLEKTAIHHADYAVIVECRFGGTQRGEWAGIAATGKRMEVPAALIFLFDGEELICERVYFDHATVVRQLATTG